MRTHNHPRPHTPVPTGTSRRSRRTHRLSARVADGVVAGYIHDISARRGDRAPRPEGRGVAAAA
jgi:hypothetical protein